MTPEQKIAKLRRALEVARKELAFHLKGNQNLIESSTTIWVIDEAMRETADA